MVIVDRRLLDQRELAAAGFDIGWWFGVRCDKCCDLYPRLIVEDTSRALCWYEYDAARQDLSRARRGK